MALLERAGINSKGLLSKTKAFLFNCYVRPLIQYGIDTFNLKDVDIRRVKALEVNCLKDCLGLFRRIHSTELFSALDLQPTIEYIKKSKLNLFIRLLKNDFTNKIIESIMVDSKTKLIENSLINDVNDLVPLVNFKANHFSDTVKKIDEYLNKQGFNFNKFKNEDPLVLIIKEELSNRIINNKKIETILQAYETNTEVLRLMQIDFD